MGTFIELFIKFMFIGVIVLALFSFGIIFQAENEVANPFENNELINSTFNDLSSNLKGLEDKTQARKDAFEEETPTGIFSLVLTSIPAAGSVFGSMLTGILNILIKLPVVFLGLDPAIVSVILTTFGILVVFGLWSLYKAGG